MVDDVVKTIILGAPNVAVAIGALYWASKLIERMVAAQETLVNQLLAMCAENGKLRSELAEKSSAANKPLV